MLQDEIIIGVLTGIILFIGSIFLAKPITRRVEEWRRTIQFRKHKVIKVKVFFIHCLFCSDKLKRIILMQNQLQRLFEIDIAEWESWSMRNSTEIALSNLQTVSRLEFCNKFQEEMQKYNDEKHVTENHLINIAVTELPFPKNYYTWNTHDRKGVVIGIRSLQYLFGDEPEMVNRIILRIIQRMLVHSLNIKGLATHKINRGCLFDFTHNLTEIQYSAEHTYLCDECKKIIERERGLPFLKEIDAWVTNDRG